MKAKVSDMSRRRRGVAEKNVDIGMDVNRRSRTGIADAITGLSINNRIFKKHAGCVNDQAEVGAECVSVAAAVDIWQCSAGSVRHRCMARQPFIIADRTGGGTGRKPAGHNLCFMFSPALPCLSPDTPCWPEERAQKSGRWRSQRTLTSAPPCAVMPRHSSSPALPCAYLPRCLAVYCAASASALFSRVVGSISNGAGEKSGRRNAAAPAPPAALSALCWGRRAAHCRALPAAHFARASHIIWVGCAGWTGIFHALASSRCNCMRLRVRKNACDVLVLRSCAVHQRNIMNNGLLIS